MKTEIAEADVAELLQLFDSVEAKQYKRPDMNGDLRTSQAVERRHGDGHPRLLSPHQRALGGEDRPVKNALSLRGGGGT